MAEGNKKNSADSDPSFWHRFWIAIVIVASGVIIMGVLSLLIMLKAKDPEKASQLLLTGLLPVIGTWVGTVLAFYFARENLEAATRSTQALLGRDEKLKTIPVSEVMIPLDRMGVLDLKADPEKTKIEEILERLDKLGRNRLPALTSKKTVEFVIHRSIATEYVATRIPKDVPKDEAAATLDSLRKLTVGQLEADKPDLYRKIKAFATVPPKASLADAKDQMQGMPDCLDVFVTSTGKPDGAVIGWITNLEITKYSRA